MDSSQKTLDLVLKASNEGIWDWIVGSEEIYYSDRILEFFGVKEGEVPNFMLHPELIVLDEDVAYFQHVLELCMMDEDEELFAVDCRCLHKSGDLRWLRVRGVIVRDEKGKAVRIAGSMIDISKRKKAEALLDADRSMLKMVTDNVPVQIYFKDKESRFVLVNQRQAEWMGLSNISELIGTTDADYFEEDHWRQTLEDERHIMESMKPVVGSIEREQWKDREETYVQTVKAPWRDSRGLLQGTFGVSCNVTDLVKAQQHLESQALRLQAKNREFEEELQLAREIQQAMLPGVGGDWGGRLKGVKGRLEVAAKYVPATELAGDYYDVLALGDGKLGILICDVMGHGVRSALVVSMLRGITEKGLHKAEDPAAFLAEVNGGLSTLLGRAALSLFSTACYAVVDFNAEGGGVLSVASAGHDFPVIVDREGALSHVFKEATKGPALGFFPEAIYNSFECSLTEVGAFLLYTDGVFESENRNGEEWGRERLEKSFEQDGEVDVSSRVLRVLHRAGLWVGGKGFDDDVCLLGVSVCREQK